MDWHERIHSNPEILSGKPAVEGTRISVELLMELLAECWTDEALFECYHHLTAKNLQAAKRYSQQT